MSAKGEKISEEQSSIYRQSSIKASKKVSRSEAHTGGSSEGAGITPEVPDESTVVSITLSEGTGITPGVPDEVKENSEAKVDSAINWGSEMRVTILMKENINIEETNDDERTKDEYIHDDEYVHDNADEEMRDAEDAETRKDDDEITDAAKADAEKTEEATALVSGTPKKMPELPPTSSSLSVSSGFAPTVTAITPVLQQTTTPIPSPPISTAAPSVTTAFSDPLLAIVQRVSELEKDARELKQVDHSTVILTLIRSQVASAVNEYLGSSLGDALQKVLQKHTEELEQQCSQKDVSEIIKIKQEFAAKEQLSKHSAKPLDQDVEAEFKQKEILFDMMRESKLLRYLIYTFSLCFGDDKHVTYNT
ncbi:hypothetical protein Tco_0305552 [Tanacetum coccineum]